MRGRQGTTKTVLHELMLPDALLIEADTQVENRMVRLCRDVLSFSGGSEYLWRIRRSRFSVENVEMVSPPS